MNLRKTAFNLMLLGSALFLFTIEGCKKDANDPPTITLTGDNPQTITLQGTYTELGATADDVQDGDLTASITIDKSEVDVNTADTYHVHYSVTDADGNNTTEDREVDVVNSAVAWAGTYAVVDTCGGSSVFNYSQIVTASSTVNGRIHFNKFADYSNNSGIYANITGNSLDLPLQTATGIGSLAETHKFSGTGVKTANGFDISYTDENVTNSSSTTCIAHYTK